MHAYDYPLAPSYPLNMPRQQGWCFGLPPGITPEQWPLDPDGFPLNHGFTLLLPEDYRIYGPEIVALSFFAVAPEHNDGGTPCIEELLDVFEYLSRNTPQDPDLYVFWLAEATTSTAISDGRYIRLFYAVILLTQQEFNRPFCEPPELIPNHYRTINTTPEWMTTGSAFSYFQASATKYMLENNFAVHRKR
ncbi:hypothetical protein ACLB1Q_27705 [Escherichia coli]